MENMFKGPYLTPKHKYQFAFSLSRASGGVSHAGKMETESWRNLAGIPWWTAQWLKT